MYKNLTNQEKQRRKNALLRSGAYKKYVPSNLSKEDKKKQIKSIVEGTKRPKLKTAKYKPSPWKNRFIRKYGEKNYNKKWIYSNLISRKQGEAIIRKGEKAYFTSGSRANVSPYAWGWMRLISVLMGGKARDVDRKEYLQGRKELREQIKKKQNKDKSK